MTLTVLDRGLPVLSSSALVNVTVVDVNDSEPQFTSSSYEVSVTENVMVGLTVVTEDVTVGLTVVTEDVMLGLTVVTEDVMVGLTVVTLQAVDADVGLNAQLEYQLRLEYLTARAIWHCSYL